MNGLHGKGLDTTALAATKGGYDAWRCYGDVVVFAGVGVLAGAYWGWPGMLAGAVIGGYAGTYSRDCSSE